ncbi:hypothetical protein BH11PAT1_BH11PAT1_3850 [soil metagenome]
MSTQERGPNGEQSHVPIGTPKPLGADSIIRFSASYDPELGRKWIPLAPTKAQAPPTSQLSDSSVLAAAEQMDSTK